MITLPLGNKCALCSQPVAANAQGHRVSVWCSECIEQAAKFREVGFEAFSAAWAIMREVEAMDWPDVVE